MTKTRKRRKPVQIAHDPAQIACHRGAHESLTDLLDALKQVSASRKYRTGEEIPTRLAPFRKHCCLRTQSLFVLRRLSRYDAFASFALPFHFCLEIRCDLECTRLFEP